MPEFALDRRRALVALVVLLAVLVVAGRFLLRPSRPPVPPPVQLAASAGGAAVSTTQMYVHVVGAVRRPGLYRLKAGARVADALARAGGVTAKARVELVNLAAPLADGQQVVVPRRGAVGAAAGSAPGGPVHLNTATLEQLDELPGIGPVTAQKILDYREQHGALGSVDELDAIPGIGPARLAQIRDLVAP